MTILLNTIPILLILPGALFAPIIHEWVKARVSHALGDVTIKRNGWLTLKPFRFFEPIGFFMILYFGVGWGRPVPTAPLYYKDKRKGIALTYITPIVVNLLLGIGAITLISVLRTSLINWAYNAYGIQSAMAIRDVINRPFYPPNFLQGLSGFWNINSSLITALPIPVIVALSFLMMTQIFAHANIGLALFNLIPVYPMSMNRLIHLFVSPEMSMKVNHYEKPMQIIMFFLLILNVIQQLLFPIRDWLIRVVSF